MDSKRQHHQRIARVLESMNSRLLQDTQCLFGGGTAIALQLDEFRLSTDIGFICSSHEGYRKLRSVVGQFSTTGLSPLFNKSVPQLREVRADRYGIRSVLDVDGVPIKFEIVREDRISLDASIDLLHGVPTISRIDAYAEKLLANSDRWADRSVLSRDILDLCRMIGAWGEIPIESARKACSAYGEVVIQDLASAARQLLQDDSYRQKCFCNLHIDSDVQVQLLTTLQRLSTGNCAPGLIDALHNDPEPGPGLA
ncbi:hypothetical protein BTO32_15545 [Marinobacter lutaoensis]|uniref:Nucleotidyl transferase AbiEii/AbiGii toxin family protein n=1 Tax=Marinobacter lutaoensis TaxID=135739 RepID=A0A1V2DPR3_9GAMM|nr:nucleotidyl transferase AbiEii/AbiGii toxin family protein [Marinobacter lutaoensis]ONF42617.1 hypothetical protein BTO32_15545 [Marinobacter lutaoensis]